MGSGKLFVNERIANISTFSENPTCIDAYKEFASVFKQAGDEFKGFSREIKESIKLFKAA